MIKRNLLTTLLFTATVLTSTMTLTGCSGKSSAVENANDLFTQNKNEQAVEVLKKAAQDDYIDAQIRLAQYYEELSRTNNANSQAYLTEARLWYQRAIRNGSPEAEYHFAMLDCNEQVNDPKLAESCQYWLESAARGNSVDAQVELANRYYSQREDPRALLNAEFWAEQAAPNSIAAADLLDKIQYAKVEDMNSVEWIIAQPANKYTIQLNVFAELSSAIDYAFEWQINNPAIYEDRMGNFAVITGVFDTQAQADRVIRGLANEVTSINTQSILFEELFQFIPQESIERAVAQHSAQRQQSKTNQNVQKPAPKTPVRSQPAQAKQQPAQETSQQPAQQSTSQPTRQTKQNQQNEVAANLSAEQKAQLQAERDAYVKLLELTAPKEWLAEQQRANRYSIILLRDVFPSQALRFVELTGVKGAYAHLNKDGTIYILGGAFDSQEAANSQLQNLPEAFNQFDPQIINTGQLTN